MRNTNLCKLGATDNKTRRGEVQVTNIAGAGLANQWCKIAVARCTGVTSMGLNRSTNQPEIIPTTNESGKTTNSASGRVAISKKAASSIVEVNATTTVPNPTFPEE